jgi:hypothetical protein
MDGTGLEDRDRAYGESRSRDGTVRAVASAFVLDAT